MSDNEDTAPSLGHSEVSSVQHPPGTVKPELAQRPDEGGKISPAIDREYSGHVLPDEPTWTSFAKDSAEPKCKLATCIIQSAAPAHDRERLAGRSSDNKVNWLRSDFRRVAKVRHLRVSFPQKRAAKRVDLRKPNRLPVERHEGA